MRAGFALVACLMVALFGLCADTATQAAETVRLTNTERRTWNTYFSNFSEVYVAPFERGKITDDALIEFGIRHNLANNEQLWTRRGLPEKYVAASVQKYFGRQITRHHAPGPIYPYKSGCYGYPTAAGEGWRSRRSPACRLWGTASTAQV